MSGRPGSFTPGMGKEAGSHGTFTPGLGLAATKRKIEDETRMQREINKAFTKNPPLKVAR